MGNEVAKIIAKNVDKAGGRTFYVGGFVRDRFLGIENKDLDLEVHGIKPDRLFAILKKIGEPVAFGKSFGVYALRGESIDIAMPRRERATGCGHKDFEVFVDPFIGTEAAARRRDFTINSIMEDVLTGEIVDHFGGGYDLKAGIIRHVDSDSFVEDPLRVLRAAQFAARFEFEIVPETIELCRRIDISTLSKERVEEELKKALLQAGKPSIFFETLREMNQLDVWFPELKSLIGLEQDSIYHPEGDVWIHTMEVVDRATRYKEKTSDAFNYMLLSLTHDLGKIVTTSKKNGRIHAYEHEREGVPLVEAFVSRITNEKDVLDYLRNMVPLHMRPNIAACSKPSLKSTNRMFDAAIAPEDLIWFAMADKPIMSGAALFSGDNEFLFDRLKAYEETMAAPYVMGRDLIEAGLEPGESFGKILDYAHKLRLAGIDKNNAMKQVMAYARKCK